MPSGMAGHGGRGPIHVAAAAAVAGIFPLAIDSASGPKPFLKTNTGIPWLPNEISAWGLIQALPTATAKTFIDDRVAQNCNTFMISLISDDTGMAGSPPNWQGNPPFTTAGDFSTPNSTYFSHADDIIDYCASKNAMVYLVVVYGGYFTATGGDQGWGDEVNADTLAHIQSFGTFVGSRYANRKNVVLMFGGDQVPGTGNGWSMESTRFNALVDNATAAAPSLLSTAHFAGDYGIGGVNDPVPGGMLSSDFAAFESRIATGKLIDGLYSYNPSIEPYLRIRAGLAKARACPVVRIDGPYANRSGYPTQPQGSDNELRHRAWSCQCEAAKGGSFEDITWTYQGDLTSGSTAQTEWTYWWQFWSAIWPKAVLLTPSAPGSTTYITSGRGTDGTTAFVNCIASNAMLIAYMSTTSASAIDVAMGAFSASVSASWFNTRSGAYTSLGTITNSGTHTFTKPDANDWALLLQVP